MFCTNCGNAITNDSKFCTKCGQALVGQPINKETPKGKRLFESPKINENASINYTNPIPNIPPARKSFASKINRSRVVQILVVLGIIGYSIYSNLDKGSIQTNNDALKTFNSGDNQQAIAQFKDASQNAVTDETKINTLKNLAYVYSTEGQDTQALSTFKEALPLATEGSFDYYLISGEIALLEDKPAIAQQNYNKAYQLNPEDFQINNALALFYLDVTDLHTQYADYPKALTFALKAHSLNNSEITLENLGIAYFFNKNYDQAISSLSQINLTQHSYIALWLGLSYAAKQDVPNAKLYLQKYVDSGAKAPQEVIDYLNSH